MSRELRHYEPAPYYDMAPQPAAPQTIELRRLLSAVRRQRWTILRPMLILGILGLVWGLSKPATYSASSTMLLDGAISSAVRQVGGIDQRTLPEDAIENARVVLTSDKLAHDVLDATGLEAQPAFLNPPQSGISTALNTVVGTLLTPVSWARDQVEALIETAQPETAQPAATAEEATGAPVDPRRRRAAALLQRGISVDRVGRSGAIAISFTSNDPAWSAAVANAYADAYTADILSANAQSVGQTNTWMDGRLDDLRTRAQEAADAAERYAIENNLTTTSTGMLLGEQAQSELNASLSTAISDRARAQALLQIYENAVAGGVEGLENGGTLSIGDDISDSLRLRLDNFNDITSRLQSLLQGSGPDHPQVAGLRQTLSSAADRLFVELQSQRQSAQTEFNVATQRVEALRESLAEITSGNSEQAAALVRLRALQQEAETLALLYQSTLTRAQEIEQQSSFPVSNVRVLSYAQVPNAPSGPAAMRTAVAAAMLGLFFGLARAALREGRENFMRTASDVTDYSPLRFLGHLPILGRARPLRPDQNRLRLTRQASPVFSRGLLPAVSRPQIPPVTIPVLGHPDSLYAETLRHIRLAASKDAEGRPVTGVTSFHPYPGRATVTLNLAGQIAATSSDRVLLIDADARDGRLSQMLGVSERKGLADIAVDGGDWRSLLLDVKNSHLTVLPCGLTNGGASDDLMIAQALRRILDEVSDGFGHVVLDVPPLYPVAQGLAILRELPGCVIVAEWGATPRDMIDLVLTNHPDLERTCLGVVYDRMVPRRLRSFLMPGSVEHMLVSSKA